MTNRKGELTSAGIDRGWPYQVASRPAFAPANSAKPMTSSAWVFHGACEGIPSTLKMSGTSSTAFLSAMTPPPSW
jgi:hypothetical protein